jgi:hypothetical protein
MDAIHGSKILVRKDHLFMNEKLKLAVAIASALPVEVNTTAGNVL